MNCWEFKCCGLEPDGKNTGKFGVCRVAVDSKFNGINNGTNAGRYCWKVKVSEDNHPSATKTLSKIMSCIDCDFFKKVKIEEKHNFSFLIQIDKSSVEL